MTHLAFSTCLLLVLSLFLIDVWEIRILRRRVDERSAKQVLALWPLQVMLHVVVFYLVATTPLTSAYEPTEIELLYEQLLSETPESRLQVPPGFEQGVEQEFEQEFEQEVHEQYI